ncbi:MAG: Spy/CpxP family protein refolding chaperone [Lentisphaerae bacterium]|nr:Spy/CpxP family protein refolding chaperone [Lentisphaerota bacterium]
MKRQLLTILLSALTAGATAFAVTHWGACPAAAGAADAGTTAARIARKLDLSTEQTRQLAEMESAYQAQLDTCSLNHCCTRREIATELFAPALSTNQLDDLAETLCHSQRAAELATLAHIRRVYDLLTPAQQDQYREWVFPCICGDHEGGAACSRCR